MRISLHGHSQTRWSMISATLRYVYTDLQHATPSLVPSRAGGGAAGGTTASLGLSAAHVCPTTLCLSSCQLRAVESVVTV